MSSNTKIRGNEPSQNSLHDQKPHLSIPDFRDPSVHPKEPPDCDPGKPVEPRRYAADLHRARQLVRRES